MNLKMYEVPDGNLIYYSLSVIACQFIVLHLFSIGAHTEQFMFGLIWLTLTCFQHLLIHECIHEHMSGSAWQHRVLGEILCVTLGVPVYRLFETAHTYYHLPIHPCALYMKINVKQLLFTNIIIIKFFGLESFLSMIFWNIVYYCVLNMGNMTKHNGFMLYNSKLTALHCKNTRIPMTKLALLKFNTFEQKI